MKGESLAEIALLYIFIILFLACAMHGRDELDRKLQAERTAEILAGSAHPVVMLSYITNPPGSRDYWKIINGGNVKVWERESWHICTLLQC